MNNKAKVTEQILQRHRSLAILRFLDRSAEYRANERVLLDWLSHLALTCSHENLQQVVIFLEDEGHLRSENVDGLLVVTLTEKGVEVANGREIVDGVGRPDPACPY